MTKAPGNHQLGKGWHSRGYLPHLDVPGLIQFVTFRLVDSVPNELIKQWQQTLQVQADPALDTASTLRRRVEKYADTGHGACYLQEVRAAKIVRAALLHFHGQRYWLLA